MKFSHTVVSLVMLIATACAPALAQSAGCGGPDDESAFLGDVLTRMVTRTDPSAVALRQALNLPQLAATEVTLVTDSRICGSATSAYLRESGQSSSRTLYVFKLGRTRYAVYEVPPPETPGLFDNSGSGMTFFDSKWIFISATAH